MVELRAPSAGLQRVLTALDDDDALAGYHPRFLAQLVTARMEALALTNADAYRALWLADPREQAALRASLPVVQTRFFRDPQLWSHLEDEVVPRVIAEARGRDRINVWVAGCATGQELYSLALLFAQQLGLAGMDGVRLFGSDASVEAIAVARAGWYPREELADIPTHLRGANIVGNSEAFTVHPELRRSVVFAQHDLLRRSPYSNLDLIVCRNTLIYFEPAIRKRVLCALHFGLREDGFLVIGTSDDVAEGEGGPEFAAESIAHRVYRKVSSPGAHPWLKSGCSVLRPFAHPFQRGAPRPLD